MSLNITLVKKKGRHLSPSLMFCLAYETKPYNNFNITDNTVPSTQLCH